MTATNHPIIKSDRRGRLRYSAEQKSVIVEAYHASGLSGPRFAAIHGVNYQTLASWLQKRKSLPPNTSRTDSSPRLLSFIPAVIGESTTDRDTQPLEIKLPGGVAILIGTSKQAQLAAILIREIQQSLPC